MLLYTEQSNKEASYKLKEEPTSALNLTAELRGPSPNQNARRKCDQMRQPINNPRTP